MTDNAKKSDEAKNDAPPQADTKPGVQKGDEFMFKRSKTKVAVTLVHDDGTVDVQEPEVGSQQRYWGGVSMDDLEPISAPIEG